MPSESPLLRLDLDSRVESVDGARMVVRSTLSEVCQLDSVALRGVLVALTEILTNSVDAQRRDSVTEPLRIEVTREGRRIVISVRDRARGFDNTRRSDATRGERDPPGLGLGLVIARGLVDDLRIEEANGETVVSLVLDPA